MALRSRLLDDNINKGLDFTRAVVETMDGISVACATIAGFERHRFIPELRPDAACRYMHMLDRAAGMGCKWSSHLARGDHIAEEIHFASRQPWSEAVTSGAALGVDKPWPFGGADDEDARAEGVALSVKADIGNPNA